MILRNAWRTAVAGALLIGSTLTASTGGGEREFASVGLSTDARAVLDAHWKMHFGSNGGIAEEGCPRGETTRWLDPNALPEGAYAYRQLGSFLMAETFARPDGANVTIIDSGCEVAAGSIRYVFPLHSKTPIDWNARLAEALRELQRIGARTLFDLAKAEAELARADFEELLQSGEELRVTGDGEDFLQTRILVTGAGIVDDCAAGFVEFRLIKGPL